MGKEKEREREKEGFRNCNYLFNKIIITSAFIF